MTFLNRLKIILFVLFLLSYGIIFAQEKPETKAENVVMSNVSNFATDAQILYTINVTGVNATGINGTVTYTVGQLMYKPFTGGGGSIDHGIQHPRETIITLGIDDNYLDTSLLSIYPNPAAEFISLDTKNIDWQLMKYRMFDVNGRKVLEKDFTGEKTEIDLRRLEPSVYFLRIFKNHKNIKNFKIIKTN